MIRIHLLGPLLIERDNQPVRGIKSLKALAIMGYLSTMGCPIPRDHLVRLFWPNLVINRGRANLSWALNYLDHLLPGIFLATRHEIVFCNSAGYWIDSNHFTALAAREGDFEALSTATSLYRGDFLEGFFLEGCSDFELWLISEQERWRLLIAEVYQSLITIVGQGENYRVGIRYANRLLALQPWLEEIHYQLIEMLAKSGQRSAALRQYETCRRVLAEELGVEPAPETTRLYERIRIAAPVSRRRKPPAG